MEVRGRTRLKVDLGCGENKQEGFLGMDQRELPGVDVVHNLEEFPWPFDSGSCSILIASHIVEHIKPWLTIDFMNECWRVLEEGGTLCIATPYPGSRGYWQDPTHCNGWNEATWTYFDPAYGLYKIYKPKPWRIQKGFPTWQFNGNMECILSKILGAEDIVDAILESPEGETLGISIVDKVTSTETLG